MEEDKHVSDGQPDPGMVIAPDSSSSATNINSSSSQPDNDQVSSRAPLSIQPLQSKSALVNNNDGLSWTGPEFAQQDKPSNWYTISVLMALALGGLTFLATHDFVSSFVVAIAIAVLGFYSLRKPKNTSYVLSDYGVSIGTKRFTYDQFRSFTVTIEGPYLTITFLPLKRFATTAGIFYQGNDEDKIVDYLSRRLPIEQHKPDIIESFLQRIRF